MKKKVAANDTEVEKNSVHEEYARSAHLWQVFEISIAKIEAYLRIL